MKLTSPVFSQEEQIPDEYTSQGDNISPPLAISDIPEQARSLALIVSDPDVPPGDWVHWLVWNIPVRTKEILEDSLPEEAVVGTNDFKKTEYGGPYSPSETHRYIFKILALDKVLDLEPGASRGELEEAMEEHVLDSAELIGLYSKE